jgi:NADPH:quinone reductase-like Zn-dependent oxidoreductase
VIEPVDAVLDLVGGETLARSYSVVKRGGIIVTFNQPPDFEGVREARNSRLLRADQGNN